MEKDKNISTSTSEFYEEYLGDQPNKIEDEREATPQVMGQQDASGNDEGVHVMVKYKALPGKANVAVDEMKSLVSEVMKEPGYVKVVIHVDKDDPHGILLYEQWKSEAYYRGDHMNTAHLRKFMNDSRDFIAGPPEITFWNVVF